MTPRDWLLFFLVVDILAMFLVAVFYLRKRELTLPEMILWGVILVIPLLGPFLLIACSPGKPLADTGSASNLREE